MKQLMFIICNSCSSKKIILTCLKLRKQARSKKCSINLNKFALLSNLNQHPKATLKQACLPSRRLTESMKKYCDSLKPSAVTISSMNSKWSSTLRLPLKSWTLQFKIQLSSLTEKTKSKVLRRNFKVSSNFQRKLSKRRNNWMQRSWIWKFRKTN